MSHLQQRRGDIPSKGVSLNPDMENLNISQAGVTKLLKGLNMNKASGSDKISLFHQATERDQYAQSQWT